MRWILFVLAVLAGSVASGQETREASIAVWNVENLFDAEDDSGRHDDELMEWWTEDLYQLKLKRLAEIISQMNDGKGPDFLGLIEVENERVVKDLVALLPQPESYQVVHYEGPSYRSIEVAAISRLPVSFSKSYFTWHYVRDILRVDVTVGYQPVSILINHWKSRWGGTLETSTQRYICATRAYQLYTEIVRENPDADVVVMGDFNDTPYNVSLTDGLGASFQMDKVLNQHSRRWLYNVVSEMLPGTRGTYYYDDEWDFLDQVIISRGLLLEDGLHYVKGSLEIFNPENVLLSNGAAPWRFGNQYVRRAERGYADHLPLVFRLQTD